MTSKWTSCLHQKFTNDELYIWMKGEISRWYYEYYRFAFDLARKAERTMKQELMRPELDAQDFMKFNYWDGGRKGLLSGEALFLDIKRMEVAYHDHNKRELELTRDVSLRQLDPVALLTLRNAGACEVTVPEWLYDRDCPGHYMRRIKSVAVSTVRSAAAEQRGLLHRVAAAKLGAEIAVCSETANICGWASKTTVSSTMRARYSRSSRAAAYAIRDCSIRICMEIGSCRSKAPELSAPGSSTCRSEFPAFDYGTIADVILHISYTARQGLDAGAVTSAIKSLFQQTLDAGPNFSLLFTLQQDFADEWQAFGAGGQFEATIRRNQFPYFTDGKTITITEMELYGENVEKHHAAGDASAATEDLWDQPRFRVPRRAGCTRSAAGAQPECNDPGVPARTLFVMSRGAPTRCRRYGQTTRKWNSRARRGCRRTAPRWVSRFSSWRGPRNGKR